MAEKKKKLGRKSQAELTKFEKLKKNDPGVPYNNLVAVLAKKFREFHVSLTNDSGDNEDLATKTGRRKRSGKETEELQVNDAKLDYLVRTFSRTKGKRHENYVLTAIWHKLDRSEIQPVTQQYIKRPGGRYALVDLYFPQIRVGVECDEAGHINQRKQDHLRSLEIEQELSAGQVLSADEETTDFQLYRIKAYENMESIERQINKAIAGIKSRIDEGGFPPWNVDELASSIAIKNYRIHVADRLAFKTIVDACRCFGKEWKAMMRAFKYIGHEHQLWCPKLAVEVAGKFEAATRGWKNVLSKDWTEIVESNDIAGKLSKDDSITKAERPRITFAKSTDVLGRSAYRFIGVYKIDKTDPRDSRTVTVHKRISDRIDLAPWLK